MEWSKLGDLLGRSLAGGLNTYGDIALQRRAQQDAFNQKKQLMLEQEAIKQGQRQRMAQYYAALAQGKDPFADQELFGQLSTMNQGNIPQAEPIFTTRPRSIPQEEEDPLFTRMPRNSPESQIPKEYGVKPSESDRANPIAVDSNRRLTLDERIARANALGMGPKEINDLIRDYRTEEANNIKKDALAYKKERDIIESLERKQDRENKWQNEKDKITLGHINKIYAENYTNRPILKEKRDNYRALVDIAKNPELLRSGKGRQLLDKIGLGDLWQSSLSDVADKLIKRIVVNESQTTSGATANTIQGIKNIEKSVPQLTQNPQAFEAIANALLYTSEAQYIESKELNRLGAQGINPDTLSERDRITKPKTKELHKKADYALKLAAFPIDFSSAMQYQPDIEFLYELPPIDQVPPGKDIVDTATGKRFSPRNGKWVVQKYEGK